MGMVGRAGIGIVGVTNPGIDTEGTPGRATPPMVGTGGGDGMVGRAGIGIDGGTRPGMVGNGTPGNGKPPITGTGGGPGIVGSVGIGIAGGTSPGIGTGGNWHLVVMLDGRQHLGLGHGVES